MGRRPCAPRWAGGLAWNCSFPSVTAAEAPGMNSICRCSLHAVGRTVERLGGLVGRRVARSAKAALRHERGHEQRAAASEGCQTETLDDRESPSRRSLLDAHGPGVDIAVAVAVGAPALGNAGVDVEVDDLQRAVRLVVGILEALHVQLEVPGRLQHLQQLPVHDEGQALLELQGDLVVLQLARHLLEGADALREVDGGQPAPVEAGLAAPPAVHLDRRRRGPRRLRSLGVVVVPHDGAPRGARRSRSRSGGGTSVPLGLRLLLGLLDEDVHRLGEGRERVGQGRPEHAAERSRTFVPVVVGPVEVEDQLREGHDLGAGLLAAGQSALAEAGLAQDAVVAAQELEEIRARLDSRNLLELRGQLRVLHHAADHRHAVRHRDLLDLAAHQHARAHHEVEVLLLASGPQALDPRVPGVRAPEAAVGRPVLGETAGGGRHRGDDLHGRRLHLVGDAGRGPGDDHDDLVADVVLLAAEVEAGLEAARGHARRHARRRAPEALLGDVLGAALDDHQDLVVDPGFVHVAHHLGGSHGSETVRRQSEGVVRGGVDIRDRPREGLRAVDHGLRRDARHQEDARGERHDDAHADLGHGDGRGGAARGVQGDAGRHGHLLAAGCAHKRAAGRALHRCRGREVELREVGRTHLRVTEVELQPGRLARRVAGHPVLDDGGAEVDDRGARQRRGRGGDGAAHAGDIGLARVDEVQLEAVGRGRAGGRGHVGEALLQDVLAQDNLREAHADAADFRGEPRLGAAVPDDRQVDRGHGGAGGRLDHGGGGRGLALVVQE
mmetsp:Transcript_37398/g.98910  ORF Transcript_37398/g.98910 Transcript_37398/m.98910 type:complete len:782 (-) Transcript_37398:1965-4310(-)